MNRLTALYPDLRIGVFLLLTSCAFTGCMSLIGGDDSAPQSAVSDLPLEPPLSVLDYFAWLQHADEEIILQESIGLQRYRNSESGLINSVQLALLLSHHDHAAPEQLARAERILEAALVNASDEFDSSEAMNDIYPGYAQFARLWQSVIQTRLKLLDTERQVSAQSQTVERLTSENQELRRQIDALRQIERQINQRDQQQDQGQLNEQ